MTAIDALGIIAAALVTVYATAIAAHHTMTATRKRSIAAIMAGTLGILSAIITGAIVAQGGAALAVALKTKDPKKRSLYISSTIPAFLGITEPAIFGINLRFVKPFVYALIGGACAGACASLKHIAGTGMGITVLPGTLLYMDHLFEYLIVNAIGFGVAFARLGALRPPSPGAPPDLRKRSSRPPNCLIWLIASRLFMRQASMQMSIAQNHLAIGATGDQANIVRGH